MGKTVDIDTCFRRLKYRADKSGYNGFISPDDFNLLFPAAEIRHFNRLYEKYPSDRKSSTSLSVFSKQVALTIDNTGAAAIPADFMYVDAISIAGVEITRVEKNRVANNLGSVYDAPDADFPIYTEYPTKLQFYPVTLGSANMDYLGQPVTSLWAYTLNNGRPVYDPTNSVNPLWLTQDIDMIIAEVLRDIGVAMADNDVEQFANTSLAIEK